jgi:hypothetical protein
VEVTRLLLGAGADPDSAVILEGPCRFTAITGAIGEGENGLLRQPPHTRARELVELLLDRGANPNDFQGLYNSQFSPGNEWLELLLERGLTTEDRADWTDSGMRTLDYVLGQAVTAGQATRVALLLRHGANAQGVNTYNTVRISTTRCSRAIYRLPRSSSSTGRSRPSSPRTLIASERHVWVDRPRPRAACWRSGRSSFTRRVSSLTAQPMGRS